MAAREKLIALRLSAEGLAYIDQLALMADVSRSEMIRTLIGEAVAARRATGARPGTKP